MIERWFPCQDVSEASSSGWGSGNSETSLFTWFAKRPIAQARAAVVCSLLPWPEDVDEQQRLQRLVREAFTGRDIPRELLDELKRHYPGEAPSILDPFSGRAMIPLEAARLGSRAVGVDYAPVATLAGSLLADYPFRDWSREPALPYERQDRGLVSEGGHRLLRDVTDVLRAIGVRHNEAMASYYPPNTSGAFPWGYLWAVTLPCHECGNRFPLTGSLVLRHPLPKKADLGQSYRVDADRETGAWVVVVHDGPPSGTPTLVTVKGKRGKSAVCPFCGHVHPKDVHTRLAAEGLGRDALLLVADLHPAVGKHFRSVTPEEHDAVAVAEKALTDLPSFAPDLPAVPNERIPPGNNHTVRASMYGARSYGDLMCSRQTLSFVVLAQAVNGITKELAENGNSVAYTAALTGYAAAAIVRKLRVSTRGCALRSMLEPNSNRNKITDLFTNEASLAFSYDYFEAGLSDGPGSWASIADGSIAALRGVLGQVSSPAQIGQGSALDLPYRTGSFAAVVTDPPYEDMIDYSDASDLFYVWLKRALLNAHPEFGVSGHPAGLQEKDEELIVKGAGGSVGDHRTREHYNRGLALAFAEARRVTAPDGVVTIIFGHGDPDVWHRLLLAISEAGLVLTGSWPARTEKGGAAGSANIVTTLTLACRAAPSKRESGRVNQVDDEVRRVIAERLPLWDAAGLALTDQLMASAGPAMEVVGRYSEVQDRKGNPVSLDRYLPLARKAVEEAANIKIDSLPLGTFDARTRFALFWARVNGCDVAPASEARWQRLASDLTEPETAGVLVAADKGVRLARSGEVTVEVDETSAVIDVALAAASAWAAEGLSGAAQVFVDGGRVDDPYLWAAIGELSRMVPEADPDGQAWTSLIRNRSAMTTTAGRVASSRHEAKRGQEERDRQGNLFG